MQWKVSMTPLESLCHPSPTSREAPVALRPNSGSTSLRHPLLSTTPHLHLGALGCPSPIFPQHALQTPLRLLPHCVSYFICLVVSYYHQTGGGQRWCFIHICIPEHRSMPQRRRCAIFADHRKEGGRKGRNRHYIWIKKWWYYSWIFNYLISSLGPS